MILGYARVSTDGQSLESQQSALRQAGATQVFSEKISGVVTDRKALSKALAALSAGDVLLVTRLDRLARSTRPSWMRYPKPVRGFDLLPIVGAIQAPRMAS
jgi:DNA invertase Pin-like site-specific DNA recombinase